MTLRIAAAQLSHETNVFSATPTDLAAFQRAGLQLGDAILAGAQGTNAAFGGFIEGAEANGFELVPIISVWATPSGMVTADAIRDLLRMLGDGLLAAQANGPIDGVVLALHGAMVTELDPDGDATVLEAVREVIGWDTPLVATLDLHANISERMVAAADVLVGYDTYPHVDMAERAREACDLVVRLVRGEVWPTVALVKPPMLPTSQRMMTSAGPMAALVAAAHEAEQRPGVLNVTVAGGFPPADVEEAGLSVVVTTDGDADLAWIIAGEIARLAWEHRDGFLGGVSTFAEATAALRRAGTGPLVLVDIGDNPWTGGPGDSAELLRFLLGNGVTDAALASIRDPESVARCVAAGVGADVGLELGGKTDRLHGAPLPCSGIVRMLSDGRYVNAGPMMAGVPVDLGPTAVVEIAGVQVLVTSHAETPIDLNVFRSHGIEPTALRVIALKGKGHFRAAFEPVAREVVLVEGPGITGADLGRLPFRNVRRPTWPLDDDARWP